MMDYEEGMRPLDEGQPATEGIKLRLFQLTTGPLGSGPIFDVAERSILTSNDRACMHVDFPLVRPARCRRAFGTYRLPSPATGRAFRSVFSLRNVWPGAYPRAWG